MKLSYYPDTDSLYVALKPGPGADTRQVAVGLDIDHASKRLDLSTLETEALPVRTYRIG